MNYFKINVCYYPKIDNNEKEIIEEVFGKNNVLFGEYKIKGMIGGAFDIQIIVDILNSPGITALLNGVEFIGLVAILIKKLFNRNNKKIEDNNTRPRYTTLIIRLEKKSVVISNINNDTKITISEISASAPKFENEEYSDEKLNKFLK